MTCLVWCAHIRVNSRSTNPDMESYDQDLPQKAESTYINTSNSNHSLVTILGLFAD